MKPLSKVRSRSQYILDSADEELRKEIESIRAAKERPKWVRSGAEAFARLTAGSRAPEGVLPDFEQEAIIQRVGRPVLAVVQGEAQLRFDDEAAAAWKRRLEAARTMLAPAIAAVGRIELTNHPWLDYAGTGWVIDADVLVTNRHVALEFAERGAAGYVFRTGFDRTKAVGVSVDFLEEIGSSQVAEYPIREVLYIAPDSGPDVAFLRLRWPAAGGGPRAVKLAGAVAPARTLVATIGYPARDSRIPDQALMDRIYGAVYDKKRLAPGLVTGQDLGSLLHDCTTLGGNSGSALVDLSTGEAVGLHFAGSFLETNYAVPSTVVTTLLRDLRSAPGAAVGGTAVGPEGDRAGRAQVPARDAGAASSVQELKYVVPVEITVRVGDAVQGAVPARIAGAGAAAPPAPVAGPATRELVQRAVEVARAQLAGRPDVVSVDAGYRFKDGWITDERAVVVSVRRKYRPDELERRGTLPLPTSFLGVPVDVAVSSAAEVVAFRDGVALERVGGWVTNYKPRPDLPLSQVEHERMKVTAHASPDAGWPTLSAFLAATKERLTIGMYDFTAPHILEAVKKAGPAAARIKLVLQAGESLEGGTKQDDVPDAVTVEELGARRGFESAWASVRGPNRIFDSAYHIKVAVRDGRALWLSSGNWQSSNQPPFDPIDGEDESPPLLKQYNREWHVVVVNDTLARLFEEHLSRDLADAKAAAVPEPETRPEPELWVPIEYFQPTAAELEAPTRYFPRSDFEDEIRVQPLLTPDNYAENVLSVVRSARERVYFQNQSLSPLPENAEKFQALLEALRDRQRAGLDVRIIFRRIGDLRKTITRLKDFGFDMDQVRLQTNCHTKGIVVDSNVVVLGSHNWTNAGTGFNRDASLIFFHDGIARYFEALFLYDWGRIGRPRIDESVPSVEVVRAEETRPRPNMVRVAASKWFGI